MQKIILTVWMDHTTYAAAVGNTIVRAITAYAAAREMALKLGMAGARVYCTRAQGSDMTSEWVIEGGMAHG